MERFFAKQDGPVLSVLEQHLPAWKRNLLKQKLRDRQVQVNGRTVSRHDDPIQAGDRVEIRPRPEEVGPRRLPMGLHVVFEDPHLIVVDKPAGLLAVSTPKEREKTALALVRNALQSQERRNVRLWPVHRIDRGTSGLLMLARSHQVRESMQANWSKVRKEYLAVVEGMWPHEQGFIDASLREGKDLKVYVVPAHERDAKRAVTHYLLHKRLSARTALRVRLETGRKHQIRVHFSNAGHPLLGDVQYGAAAHSIGRPALHAHRLHFPHPHSGQRIELESPIPADLQAVLRD